MGKEELVEWMKPNNLECVHLLKMISFIFRLMLFMLVNVAGMMLLTFPADAQVKVVSWGGWATADSSTCYFLTSKEYGFKWKAEFASFKWGTQTFCGLTPEEVASPEGWQSDLKEVIFGWPVVYFFSSMFFAGTFMCFSFCDLLNDTRSKYKGLSWLTGGLRSFWTYCFLTILPNYLISPMGSVTVLPDPAEKIALIRTPPDYGFISFCGIFLIMPTCCVVGGTCLCVSKGDSVEATCPSAYKCTVICSSVVVSLVILLVIHAYVSMGNIFFIDLKIDLTFNLTFVAISMLAKCFLGLASVLETLIFVINLCKKKAGHLDKAQAAISSM